MIETLIVNLLFVNTFRSHQWRDESKRWNRSHSTARDRRRLCWAMWSWSFLNWYFRKACIQFPSLLREFTVVHYFSESEVNENISERYICKESLVEYTKWNENLQKITKKADEFLKNPNMKILSRELRVSIDRSIRVNIKWSFNFMAICFA